MFTDVPGKPGKASIGMVDKTTMKITWSHPESDGGSPIKGYVVEICKEADTWVKINETQVGL